LVIDPSDEGSHAGIRHVAGEVELDNPLDRAGEVPRSGEVVALIVDDDGVPASALKGEARKIDCAHVLTCVVQNQREEQVQHIR